MYLLDTNVVSELRKVTSGKADKNVIAWNNTVAIAGLYLSAIVIHEIELGVLLMERRDPTTGALFRAWLGGHVLPAFSGRILAVDTTVAQRSAQLHVPNTRPNRDAFIAATALVHGMTVVTRNVKDFDATGVAILNPWDAAPPTAVTE
jgi:predicted nucleic acid-binding protein